MTDSPAEAQRETARGQDSTGELSPARDVLMSLSQPRLWIGYFGQGACIALSFLLLMVCRSSSAHDLEVDELTLWPSVQTGSLRGQILFDPAHTRTDEEVSDPAATHAKISKFLEQNLQVRADESPLPLKFEVRELYAIGGAVGGDSVMISAVLPTTSRSITVAVGEGFEQLVVRLEGMPPDGDGGKATGAVALVAGGTSSPSYRLGGALQGPSEGGSTEEPKLLERVRRFVILGFQHILPYGWDHLLFVLSLTLGSYLKLRRLVLELATFTFAHTVALGLGALELIVVAPIFVEPLIALSIAAVALENLRNVGSSQTRIAMVFVFGLVHGQGFARALSDIGLSGQGFLVPLLSFNVGVEIGQLFVVLLALLLLAWLGRSESRLRASIRTLCFGIAAVGVFVAIVRVFQGVSEFAA